VVHAGIVESGNQMGRSGPGCGNTHAKLARKLRMCTGHERGHFLVPRLNEIDLVLCPSHRAEHTVDAVAGITEHSPHTPFMEPRHDIVAYCLCHNVLQHIA